jgi:hypothetical protein
MGVPEAGLPPAFSFGSFSYRGLCNLGVFIFRTQLGNFGFNAPSPVTDCHNPLLKGAAGRRRRRIASV